MLVTVMSSLLIAVRYVNADFCWPKERLVRMIETKDKTGAGQAKDIVSCATEAE